MEIQLSFQNINNKKIKSKIPSNPGFSGEIDASIFKSYWLWKNSVEERIKAIIKSGWNRNVHIRWLCRIQTIQITVSCKKEYGQCMGITVCGELDGEDCFEADYYFPYFEGSGITTYSEVSIERRIEKKKHM